MQLVLTVSQSLIYIHAMLQKHSGQHEAKLKGLDYRSYTSRVRFPGICTHAKRLRVSRIHLYFVLTGARRSPRIEAYAAEHNIRKAS